MLNPGGYLAIADLYPEDGSFHDPGVEVHYGFDPESLTAQLQVAGFKKTSKNQCFVIRKVTSEGQTREYPVFLITAVR